MDITLILYYIGIAIVFISHIWMLIEPEMMNKDGMMKGHAIINLVAAIFIAVCFISNYDCITTS